MGSKFSDKKFSSKYTIEKRKLNTREERKVGEGRELLLFSFKDWDQNKIPPGQKFKQWEK